MHAILSLDAKKCIIFDWNNDSSSIAVFTERSSSILIQYHFLKISCFDTGTGCALWLLIFVYNIYKKQGILT